MLIQRRMLALPEKNSHQKLKLSHTWAAMLRLELDHLAQKIREPEGRKGRSPCLVWALILTLYNGMLANQSHQAKWHWDRYTNFTVLYTEEEPGNGGYMAAFKWLSFVQCSGEQKLVSKAENFYNYKGWIMYKWIVDWKLIFWKGILCQLLA